MARAEEQETDEFVDTADDGQQDDAAAGGAPVDAKAGGKPAGKEAKPDAEAHEEIRSLRTRTTEAENAARYWYERAKGVPAAGAPAPADAADDKPLSVDLVDAISSGDKKAIKTALGELGFVDQATLQRHVTAARSAGAQEQGIYRDFPELRDNESEFFKATQKQFAELVADGADPNSLGTTKAAAKLARAEMATEGQRDGRVRRQAGDRGRTPSRGRNDAGGDNDLDTAQLAIIRGFQNAGADVTEENYRKRAESGVRMSGVKTRRQA